MSKKIYHWRGWMTSKCGRYATDTSMIFCVAKVTTPAGLKVVEALKKQKCSMAKDVCGAGVRCDVLVCRKDAPLHDRVRQRAAAMWREQASQLTIPAVMQEGESRVYFSAKDAASPKEVARIHPGYLELALALFGRKLKFAVNNHFPDKWPVHVLRGTELVAMIAPMRSEMGPMEVSHD